jgi:hypothetical protein
METYSCKKEKLNEHECRKLHTKQLLDTLRCFTANPPFECMGFCTNYSECATTHEYNINLVKEILSTREHVLNKQESKALRKEKIKRGV